MNRKEYLKRAADEECVVKIKFLHIKRRNNDLRNPE